MRWRERDGVPWLEAELPGARAAFSTRAGGVSAQPFKSLNLGWLTGDESRAVRENRRRLAAALRIEPGAMVGVLQVHGADVLRDRTADGSYLVQPKDPPRADGQSTAGSAVAPYVLVADCLPVALAGPGGVAMLHCGWRGLAAGIVAAGVESVAATHAAIGPGIGPCCFEVGEEVLAEFDGLGPGHARGRMLDLPEVAERRLRAAGVEDVERAGLCTSCDAERFYSHRRDGGETGRQAGVVFAWS